MRRTWSRKLTCGPSKFIGGFRGGNVRAWVLRIVRNTCYTWMHQNRPQHPTLEFDEEYFGPDPLAPTPEETISRSGRSHIVRRALEGLPPQHREVHGFCANLKACLTKRSPKSWLCRRELLMSSCREPVMAFVDRWPTWDARVLSKFSTIRTDPLIVVAHKYCPGDFAGNATA